MKTIRFLVYKEFLQIKRNKMMLSVVFLIPIIQLLILIYAADIDMNNIRLGVIDKDLSETSSNLINVFKASPFYELSHVDFSVENAETLIQKGDIDAIIHIPSGFERKLVRNNHEHVQILINAININSAGLINSYTQTILRDFNTKLRMEAIGPNALKIQKLGIISRFWYNQDWDNKIYLLPGVLAIIITLIGLFLPGISLIREKEIGTIEQLFLTPIRQIHLTISKIVPYWLIALFELTIGLLIGFLFFNLPLLGNILALFLISLIYLLVVLSLGTLIAAISRTQQQFMFLIYIFVILFIMMGGIFLPYENMPDWAQEINYLNPFSYYMKSIRMVLLKGSGMGDLGFEFGALSIYAMLTLSAASFKYCKTT